MTLLQALKAHLYALLGTLCFWLPIFHFTKYFHPFELSIFEGLFASFIGVKLGMPLWWIPINLFFFPFVIVCYSFQIPSWVGLSFFIFLFVFNLNAIRDRVPLYLTSYRGKNILNSLLPTDQDFKFIDLGCGFGGTLNYLANHFSRGKFVGVETAPVNFLVSKIRSLHKKNCQAKFENLWKHDLSSYDVVYAFLSPQPMPMLWEKAKKEMKKGSIFISNSFVIPGVKPSRIIEVDDWRKSKIYVWEIN